MKKHIKILCLALTMAFILPLLSACGNTDSSKSLTKIKLNEVVRSVFYTPMYAAINKNFFKEQGIEIDLSTGQGADKTMQQVLSGNAQIGFCGPEQVVYLYNQGREDYAVVFAQLTKRDGSFLVGRKNEPNFDWSNLKGKTIIGGRPGGVPEMTLEYVIRQHKLVPGKDVKIITNLAFTATASAFKSGTGDYVALFEPTATILEKEKAGYIVSSIGTSSGEIPYTCFFTTKSYLEKNESTVQRFTNALYRGQLWVEKTDSKIVAKSILNFFPSMDLDTLARVIDRYKAEDAWVKNPVLTEKALSNLENIIETYNKTLLPKRPPYDKIVTTKYAKEAAKNIK